MNTSEHLLACTVEEGVEIAEEVSALSRSISKIGTKCLRFGLDDRNVLDPTGPANRERLVAELIDLFALTEMMVEAGMIPADWLAPEKVAAKKARVLKFMEHAKNNGALVGPAKRFRITHKVLDTPPQEFDENAAPDWLTSRSSVPGSTMDMRWFWLEHVLTLPIGGQVMTDMRIIVRIA